MKTQTGKSATIKLSDGSFIASIGFKFGEILINKAVSPTEYNMIVADSVELFTGGISTHELKLRKLNVSRIPIIRRIELYILKKLLTRINDKN